MEMVSNLNPTSCCLVIGNTRWHWAFRKSNSWHFLNTFPDPQTLQSKAIKLIAWTSVGKVPEINQIKAARKINLLDIPLLNLPPWIGIDRALGAWAAFKQERDLGKTSKGLLIADAGTVLSLTKIKANGQFAGGQLMAGWRLQQKAMSQWTENLIDPGPVSLIKEKFPFSTQDAMQRGILESLTGTIIEAQKASQYTLWLCGGDAEVLSHELKYRRFKVNLQPNLMMEGMINIIDHLETSQLQDPSEFDRP